MGDFNDNPNNKSFKKVLNTKSKPEDSLAFYLFNPMEKLYKKGIGSLAYKDKWSLFDQMIFSNSFLDNKNDGWEFKKAAVFNKDYLQTKIGKYKGYPKRTFTSNNKYNKGFSDHYPVYSYLFKKAFK